VAGLLLAAQVELGTCFHTQLGVMVVGVHNTYYSPSKARLWPWQGSIVHLRYNKMLTLPVRT